jgi:hypothetical protein
MATKVCTIEQFYGIVQHRDGSLLGIGTAADARNMDASDGNLSVAKGYEKRVDIPIPGTDKLVKLIVIMGEADRYVAVGREHVYFYNGTAWSSVYTFETPLAKDAVSYVQAKINIDDYIIICTGESPMLKVKAADGETAVFGSADNGSEAKCNYICKYYGRVFAAGDPLNPNRLYWSCVPGDGRTIEYWLMVEGSADASGDRLLAPSVSAAADAAVLDILGDAEKQIATADSRLGQCCRQRIHLEMVVSEILNLKTDTRHCIHVAAKAGSCRRRETHRLGNQQFLR